MKKILKGCGIAFVVLVVIGVIGNLTGKGGTSSSTQNSQTQQSSNQKAEPTAVPIEVSAVTLYKDYETNELAGDKKYKDKQVVVSGKIDSIDQTFGVTSVILEVEFLKSIRCSFDDDKDPQLLTVKKGDKVKIQGKVEGFNSLTGVTLKSSKIL